MAEAFGFLLFLGIVLSAVFGKRSEKKIFPSSYNPHYYD